MPAVRRAASILWLLAERSAPMTLSQIAREAGILPSTCLHILREMAASRLIAFDPGLKTYRLGQGLVDLARAVGRYDPFVELVGPHLQAIAAKFGVTATATAMIDAEHMACVGFAHPPVANMGTLNVTLGGRVPTYSGAAGRCLAAFGNATNGQLRQRFNRVRWQVPMRFDDWLLEVERTRRDGYGEDDGAFTLGVTTLATPVFSPDGGLSRVIGIGAITAQLDAARKARIVEALKHAAQDVSRRLSE